MTNNQIWHLVARKLSGEASLDEIRELEQLLQDNPEIAYRVDLYNSYFEQPLQQTRTEEKKRVSWQKTHARLQEEFPGTFGGENNITPSIPVHKSSFLIANKKWLAIAAVLVIAVTSAFYFVYHSRGTTQEQLAVKASDINEMNTMRGTRSKTVLPDGTVVWLNSESRIAYNADFGKTKREVTLTGEAFFDVMHNAEVPMVVHAKNVNIWVKGTAFNVRSYPESGQVETSLIRGAVELTTDADPERKILLKPNEKIVVDVINPDSIAVKVPAPVQQVSSSQRQNLYHIEQLKESRFNIIPEISWVQNRLVFDNEIFTDVISKMEKWYNVEIVLENKKLERKSFSGAFEKENITEALQALQFINHFDFEIKGNKIFIK